MLTTRHHTISSQVADMITKQHKQKRKGEPQSKLRVLLQSYTKRVGRATTLEYYSKKTTELDVVHPASCDTTTLIEMASLRRRRRLPPHHAPIAEGAHELGAAAS